MSLLKRGSLPSGCQNWGFPTRQTAGMWLMNGKIQFRNEIGKLKSLNLARSVEKIKRSNFRKKKKSGSKNTFFLSVQCV